MIIDKQLKHLFKDLLDHQDVEIMLNGSNINLHTSDNRAQLFISTPVYLGGNYIPLSVRECISRKAPFDEQHISTFLSVDEDNYLISLNFNGNMHELHADRLIPLLHEFSWLADEWKLYLDEHDKNDLVHVRVKP